MKTKQSKIKSFSEFSYSKLLIPVITIIFVFNLLSLNIYAQQTPVEKYGQLIVKGNRIVDQNGKTVQLRGMSLYWSQWKGQYYNYKTIKWLRDDWNCTVIRAAMAVESGVGGYLSAPNQEKLVDSVVVASIKLGIYVLIDWHQVSATLYTTQAQNFFVKMAKKYGKYPNIIYEPFNEPNGITWSSLKPYFAAVTDSIRKYDTTNLIVCGTPTWSQDVDIASKSKLSDKNTAYTLHFYAATHKQWLRDKATTALKNGIALFVTEYGTCEASGTGVLDSLETRRWWKFLDNNWISWSNWSLADLSETSAALKPGASPAGGWDTSMIKPSGKLIWNELHTSPDTFTPPPVISESINLGGQLLIFPNPTSGIINIKLSNNDKNNTIAEFYDNSGRIILTKKLSSENTAIDLSNFESSIYFLKIIRNNQVFYSKVIKR